MSTGVRITRRVITEVHVRALSPVLWDHTCGKMPAVYQDTRRYQEVTNKLTWRLAHASHGPPASYLSRKPI